VPNEIIARETRLAIYEFGDMILWSWDHPAQKRQQKQELIIPRIGDWPRR
jgi:hypothetical protein